MIRLCDLTSWDNNPRLSVDAEALASLKASILEVGQIQNLIGVNDPKNPGKVIVIAGDTRRTAMQELADEGKMAFDAPVSVDLRDFDPDSAEALALALSENMVRVQMTPTDECGAMAQLLRKGKTIDSIAALFNYSAKTVRQRLAIGNLNVEALGIVRDGTRDLDWARALTMADEAMQIQIAQDVRTNPAAWKDGVEIRRFLTAETIPADNALFDLANYKGRIVYDMFDSNKLADRAAFWELQNAAIEALRADLLTEGWSAVDVVRQPVEKWRYGTSDDMDLAKVILEVLPNGKVTALKGLVEIHESNTDSNDALPIDPHYVAVEGDAVRVTPALAEYAAGHRTAMVQAALADDFRACMEITVLGLIGHGELAIRGADYRFAGPSENRVGPAFGRLGENQEMVNDLFVEANLSPVNRSDAETLAFVRALADAQLQRLFTLLVARKIGQSAPRRLDDKADGLLNTYGAALVDVRAWWTPDAAFFNQMTNADLRRIAYSLLPGHYTRGLSTSNKSGLVRVLTMAFNTARDGDGNIDAADAHRLNTWVPGLMSYPGVDDTQRAAQADSNADAFDALFAGA